MNRSSIALRHNTMQDVCIGEKIKNRHSSRYSSSEEESNDDKQHSSDEQNTATTCDNSEEFLATNKQPADGADSVNHLTRRHHHNYRQDQLPHRQLVAVSQQSRLQSESTVTLPSVLSSVESRRSSATSTDACMSTNSISIGAFHSINSETPPQLGYFVPLAVVRASSSPSQFRQRRFGQGEHQETRWHQHRMRRHQRSKRRLVGSLFVD